MSARPRRIAVLDVEYDPSEQRRPFVVRTPRGLWALDVEDAVSLRAQLQQALESAAADTSGGLDE